ncbi:MAG TPA: thioesterase family protein [Solirubrobacterales bacterium]|nr:thioesterase family protein [Solirubrobacterales bacterium]
MATPFVHQLRIRYGECDPQGIVFNANYVAFFDHVFTELWRQAFGSYRSMVDRGVDMVVAEMNLTFRGSARFDDLVEIEATIERLGTTSMTTRLELAREGEPLVEATIRHVFVDTASWSKTPIPTWLRDGLTPYVALAGSDGTP